MGEECGEGLLVHVGGFFDGQRREGGAWAEFGEDGHGRGCEVVGAYGGADVASVEVAVEVGVGREVAAMLDGQVGEASAGVDGSVVGEGTGGACFDASATVAAGARFGARGGGEVGGCQDFAEKEAGSESGDDEVVVASDESESGLCGPVAFAQRCGVDADSCLSAEGGADVSGDGFELCSDNFMIVCADGIGGYCRCHRGQIAGRGVGDCAGDDRSGVFEQKGGVVAQFGVAFEVVHRCVASGGDPSGVGVGCFFGYGADVGDAETDDTGF